MAWLLTTVFWNNIGYFGSALSEWRKKSQMCRLDQQFARFHLSWIRRPHSFFSQSFSKHQIWAYKKKPKMMFFHGSIRHLICFKIFFFIISHLYLQLGKEPRARGTARVLHLFLIAPGNSVLHPPVHIWWSTQLSLLLEKKAFSASLSHNLSEFAD